MEKRGHIDCTICHVMENGYLRKEETRGSS